MSLNEAAIFAVLILIGIASGFFTARRSTSLFNGLVAALFVAILVTGSIVFLIAFFEVSPRSESLADSVGSALGITVLYGIGSSLVSGLSALLSSWVTFKSRGPV